MNLMKGMVVKMEEEIKEKSCGCIITEKGKVLLIKHNQGHWDFPKGHVENNETEKETALREVKEETNLDVEIQGEKRYTVKYVTDKGNLKQVVYFLAKPISRDLKPQENEISEIEWLPFDEAEERITYETSKKLWKKVRAEM